MPYTAAGLTPPLATQHAGRTELAAALAAVLVPLLLVLQPLSPSWLAGIAVYGRLLVGPLLVALLLPQIQVWPGLLLASAIVLATGYVPMTERPNDFAVLACSLFGTIVMSRFGAWAGSRSDLETIWRSLVTGVTLANAVSLLVYSALLNGYLDPVEFLELINKDDPREQGLNRFSLGNAIEIPYMLTALLYAGVALSRRPTGYVLPATLNLAAALVSQSRIVILMAFLLQLRELARSRSSIRFAVAALMIGGVALTWEQVSELAESLLLRIGGEDFGSAEDRAFLFGHVISAFTPQHLAFGEGLTSAAALLERTVGEYRTVEAILLQLLYEVGLVGVGLVLIATLASTSHYRARWRPATPVGLLSWLQFLAFLPVTTISPVLGFALGAVSLSLARDNGSTPPRQSPFRPSTESFLQRS